MNTKRLVVAKYKENVEWAKSFNGDILIYDKNHNETIQWNEIKQVNKNLCQLNLHPFGWEEHTKFIHIIENYHQLYDWEIFVQGHPFDHCHDLLDRINNLQTQENYENGYIELSHHYPMMCRWYGSLLLDESDQTETNPKEFENGINPHGQSKSMVLKYFRPSIPNVSKMKPYSMYAVKRENILQYSLETYKKFFKEKFDPESPFADKGIRWFLEYGNHLMFNRKYLND